MVPNKYYAYIAMAMMMLCSILSGAVVCMVMDPESSRVIASGAAFAGMVRKKQKQTAVYIKLDEWLRKNGAGFHLGKRTDPGSFVTICMILGVAGFLAGNRISAGSGIVLGTGLGLLLPPLLPALNRSDNRKMLHDIRLIYHSMGVQIKSGVYVTEALAECSASVENMRRRSALSCFYADVIMKSDIYAALEKFRSSFDDRYIDSLCMTVVQALESGQALDLLKDLAEQASDMENEIFAARKASLDRLLTLSQLMVLGAVLGTALYTCIIYMMSRAVGFR